VCDLKKGWRKNSDCPMNAAMGTATIRIVNSTAGANKAGLFAPAA
jgi:hypothetical protein